MAQIHFDKLQLRREKRNVLCEIEALECRSAAGVYMDFMCKTFDSLQQSKGVGSKTTPLKIPTNSNNNTPLKAVSFNFPNYCYFNSIYVLFASIF